MATKKITAAASASNRALDAFQAKMDKAFGAGVFSMSSDIAAYDVIPTGSIVLDYYLQVGGYVTGRLHEIWGPEGAGKTTMSLIAVREAQRKFPDKLAAWIDVEQRLDRSWAVQHGVDLSRMVIVTPGSAEDVADQLKEICRSGLFSIAVVDSVGAMLPEKAKDKDADESVMGKEAQVITRMVKLNAVEAKKSNTTVLLLNQVRANFGYGCVHGDTPVPFVDGSSAPIREVVKGKIDREVWGWDGDRYVPRRIVGWHENGSVDDREGWIHFTTDVIEARGGRHGFTLTPNHRVLTDSGWVRADELLVGSKIASRYRSVVSSTLMDFLSGCLVGDSHITPKGQLMMQDSNDPGYLAWKVSKLSPAIPFAAMDVGGRTKWVTGWSHELRRLRSEFDGRNPSVFVRDHLSDLGMALWYMDDGWIEWNGSDPMGRDGFRCGISAPRPGGEDAARLLTEAGWDATYTGGSIYLSREVSRRFLESVAHLIPPCMERKLPVHLRGQYQDFQLDFEETFQQDFVEVVRVQPGRNRDARYPGDLVKYDITVDGVSNYLVGGPTNGVTVHNSDTTTPGGFALKHSTTTKLNVKRAGGTDTAFKMKINGEDRIVGHMLAVNIQRNSVAPAYRTAQFPMFYIPTDKFGPVGIDTADEAATIGILSGVIQLGGSWYTIKYSGERVQGREALVAALRNDPATVSKIRELALLATAPTEVDEEGADVDETVLESHEEGNDNG
jgi:RecA/RadA recombinase